MAYNITIVIRDKVKTRNVLSGVGRLIADMVQQMTGERVNLVIKQASDPRISATSMQAKKNGNKRQSNNKSKN